MNHEAYERTMIDTINQHAAEAAKEPAKANWSRVVTKHDARVVVRGLKRTLLALFTAVTFALAVISLIKVASAPGYLAVLLFFLAIIELLVAFVLLYAQGITYKIPQESKGESK